MLSLLILVGYAVGRIASETHFHGLVGAGNKLIQIVTICCGFGDVSCVESCYRDVGQTVDRLERDRNDNEFTNRILSQR